MRQSKMVTVTLALPTFLITWINKTLKNTKLQVF